MATARDLIIEALDEFDVEEFVDPDFNEIAADKIVAKLEWGNFKIVTMVRTVHKPLPRTEDEAAEAGDNGRNTGGKSYR